jgi:hypothetical protein
VTGDQQILFFDGTSWTSQYTQADQDLSAIGGVDAAHVIAGGTNGLILDGTH